ncbi:hypothetical protein BCR33DRAFT_724150 [Rhizoclosmatium globosum]|uniref:Uncharacterized protein n=1 Tax=Rhizoclosmatium globosum TaxID=329046 RepID=A0A1Y2B7X8_9FUNG|nr:hypothetical protein BCR33DRAFT_724150 [Rhizoclosmatium globosum]|eukprot:ORY30923.1 hypothetical protein BCR33DRAFT_724150 [Rhizoclosmatium globosum]
MMIQKEEQRIQKEERGLSNGRERKENKGRRLSVPETKSHTQNNREQQRVSLTDNNVELCQRMSGCWNSCNNSL